MKWFSEGQLHTYQRFDKGGSWSKAKEACEQLQPAGHLASITSAAEQDFIEKIVLYQPGPDGYYFWLGATDDVREGVFRWVTGEPFSAYSNWSRYANEPDQSGPGYVLIYNSQSDRYVQNWYDVPNDFGDIGGYICEWETEATISTASVPDLNGNGAPEIAALFVDYPTRTTTVLLKDGDTGAKVGARLTFGTSPPAGVAALHDLNGNGGAEIAVLYMDGRQPRIWIKDAKTGVDVGDKLFVLSQRHAPRSISVVPDSNNNGAEELLVSGVLISSGKAYAETRDGKTGVRLGNLIPF